MVNNLIFVPLLVCFPGGGGGNWLSSLIYRLEHNNTENFNILVNNFHNEKKSASVITRHCPYTPITEYQYLKKIIFTGLCSFNIYVNVVYKRNKYYCNLPIGAQENFDIQSNDFLFNEAMGKILYPVDTIDLNFDLLFDNTDQFIQDLYNILDQVQITYTKNDQLILNSIQQYKKSCPNPMDIFEDYDNIVWLGWAVACVHELGIKDSSGKCDFVYQHTKWTRLLLKKELLPHKDAISEFTLKRMRKF